MSVQPPSLAYFVRLPLPLKINDLYGQVKHILVYGVQEGTPTMAREYQTTAVTVLGIPDHDHSFSGGYLDAIVTVARRRLTPGKRGQLMSRHSDTLHSESTPTYVPAPGA